MKKSILLLLLFFSFSAIRAENNWSLSDGTLTISGANVPDYEEGSAPWYNERNDIETVVIEASVTSIGNYAFAGCSSITSITFNESTPPEFGESVFDGVGETITVRVPANSREAYVNALEDFGLSNIKAFLSLNDNIEEFIQDSQIEDVDVSFTRYFPHTKWQAIYLPFSLKYDDLKDDFEVAYISDIRQYDDNKDGDIDMTVLDFETMKSGSTTPNTPYLIMAKKIGEKTLSAKNVTVYEAETNSFEFTNGSGKYIVTGTYKKITYFSIAQTQTKPYVMNRGLIEQLTPIGTLSPFSWYMEAEYINFDYVEPTGIKGIKISDDKSPVYDINGRRVNENSLKPGLYIRNGRKFVVK